MFDDLLGAEEPAGFFGDEEAEVDLFGKAPSAATPASEAPAAAAGEHPVSSGPVAKPQSEGYVVLARKYRPQTFDDIVGQQGVQQGLRGAIATGQISHAYLFSGPRGTGKTSTARILAKALNCQNGGPRPDPCGKCASCRSITLGSSLDVIEIDAASNTGVDNIRELKSGVVLAPFSRYKVYIVDEVHMLSNQAFNALLKTLEEPPPQVIFVLATTELHKVPETIVSRCQTFLFRRFSLEELKSQLGHILDIEVQQRGLRVDPEQREKILDLVARNAEGGMRDAQVTLDQVLVLSKGTLDFESVRRFLGMADMEALGAFVENLHQRNSRELLELIDRLVAEGQDLELFLKGVCEYLRDLLLVKCSGKDTPLINVSENRALELEQTSKALSSAFMVNTIEHFLKVIGEMKTSGQPRTVLELAVLKLTLLDPSADLENILKRLDALEKGASSPGGGGGSAAQPAQPRAQAGPKPAPMQAAPAPVPASKEQRIQTPEVESAQEHDALEAEAEGSPVHSSDSAVYVGERQDLLQSLTELLKNESPVLALNLEKCGTSARLAGNVLNITLNGGCKLDVQRLQRDTATKAIAQAAAAIVGKPVQVKLEVHEGIAPGPKVPAPPTFAPRAAVQRSSEPTATMRQAAPAQAPAADSRDVEAVVEGDGELKIYYPEEIREKTMLEVSSSEFQRLLKEDGNLKTLVEKTMQVFGIDSSRLKFHRSTLA